MDYARANSIRVIFVQPQFSEKSARIIADAIHGNVIKADPMAHDWADNLRNVAEAFRSSFGQ
ncbi:hypothetical protein [Pseudodesulfovibrio tunisiensis]|uniref:hypothetical protein n=1 Tax=Pseudodesulfovibrio tunisiensis TaxID=463192 RepID=UPI003C76B97A